jgi:hypothetical protein
MPKETPPERHVLTVGLAHEGDFGVRHFEAQALVIPFPDDDDGGRWVPGWLQRDDESNKGGA